MASEQRACQNIVKLLVYTNKLLFIDKSLPDTPTHSVNWGRESENSGFDFEVWSPNVVNLISNAEDIALHESMKNDRTATDFVPLIF